MSRIGNKQIAVPSGVELALNGRDLTVKGPKGQLEWQIPLGIVLKQEDASVQIERERDDRQTRAFHGLTRALVQNMVTGVSAGFTRELRIEGVGYRAKVAGKDLEISVGYSNPVNYTVPVDVDVDVQDQTKVIVSGIDRQKVGQVAAEIRKVRPPEPYKGKGIRYADERVRRKAGKTGVG